MTSLLKTISLALATQDMPRKGTWAHCETQTPKDTSPITKVGTSVDTDDEMQDEVEEGLERAVRLFSLMKIANCNSVLANIITSKANVDLLQHQEDQNIIVKDESYFVPFYFAAPALAATMKARPQHKKRSNEYEEDSFLEKEKVREEEAEVEPPKKRPSSEEDHRLEEYSIAAIQEKLPKWVKSSSSLRDNSTIFLSGPDDGLKINIAKELLNMPKGESSIKRLKEVLTNSDHNDKSTKKAVGLCEELESVLYVYQYHFPIIIKFAYAMTNELSRANKEVESLKKKSSKCRK